MKHDYKEAMHGSLILNCMRRKYISFTLSRLAL